MKKLTLVVLASLLVLCAGNALAVPIIDGVVTSATEWDGYIIYGTDPNESGISDYIDISAIYMKVVTGELAGNGLYFRIDTWAAPSYAGDPTSFGESFFDFYLDYDGNSTPERRVSLNGALDSGSKIVGVYSGPPFSPGVKLGDNDEGTTRGLSSIIEMYVPDTLLSTTIGPDFGLYAFVDGNGSDPDDRMPASGFIHPVPEPASAAMLGVGLMGLVGSLIRRKFMA